MNYEIDSGSFLDTTALNLSLHNESISKERQKICNAEIEMKRMIDQGEAKEADCPVTHRFSKGVYLREVFMPAGTIVIGKIHATEHFNVLLTGRVTVLTAEGTEEITAPYTFISKAGVKKVVTIHEDCRWQTIHVTEKTCVDEIEKDVIVCDHDQLVFDGLIKEIGGNL